MATSTIDVVPGCTKFLGTASGLNAEPIDGRYGVFYPDETSDLNEVYLRTFRRHPVALQNALLSMQDNSALDEVAYTAAFSQNFPDLLAKVSDFQAYDAKSFNYWSCLREALILAQARFGHADCQGERSENSLTGSLVSRLIDGTDRVNWHRKYKDYPGRIHLWFAELIRHGYEQSLGGDLALILHDGSGHVAVCLQAKRTHHIVRRSSSSRLEDIRSPKLIGDRQDPYWQLGLMRKFCDSGENKFAAYLFYDDMMRGRPVLPLAKDVWDLESTVEDDGLTSLDYGVLDLASYVTSIGFKVRNGAGMGDDDLPSTVAALRRLEISTVVAISENPSFGPLLGSVLEKHFVGLGSAASETGYPTPSRSSVASPPIWLPPPPSFASPKRAVEGHPGPSR